MNAKARRGKNGRASSPTRRKRAKPRSWSKRFGQAALLLTIIAGISAAVGYFSYQRFVARDVVLSETPWTVNIPRGGTVWGTWRHLVRDGVVDHSRWFALWVYLNQPSCLQAGRHEIPSEQRVGELFETLCQPTQGSGIRVVMPEGLNVWSASDRLAAAGVTSRSAFLEVARAPFHIPLYELTAPTAEGFLFPDTWEFEEGTPPQDVVQRMTDRFVSVWRELNEEYPHGVRRAHEDYGLGMYELVVMASIVEKEAMVDEERPLIAAVLFNRLRRRMRIQCDPTCVYGEDRYRERPSPRWCRHQANAWSTYANDGLPPTPIANPGRASLAAVLDPADDDEVLYFVARMDGTHRHVFARSLEEHSRNVRRYLRGGQR